MIFRRKRPAAGPATFSHRVEAEGVLLSLGEDGVPVSDWGTAVPGAASTIACALSAAEDGRKAPDGRALAELRDRAVWLHPAWVAGLDERGAIAVGLPATSALALDLKPVGRIDQADFRIDARWVRPGGQPVRAKLDGAFITTADGVRRIPEPLWSLQAAASALKQPQETAERFEALATLRGYWPEDARSGLETDDYLSALRVHYASSFSLKLGRRDAFDFDPVLFSAASVAQADAEGRAPDEELDNVLSPSAQRLFADERFRREAEARPVYVLRDGEYVFIAPELRPALAEVRQLQAAPQAERRAFVLNPRRVLRERLGTEAAERIDLDGIFIETEQFSERVAGVDVWRKPVLPWLVPTARNEWIPERFGLKVGEDYFVAPAALVPDLLVKLTIAEATGAPEIDVEGLLEPVEGGALPPKVLPVNEQLLEAVRSLAELAPRRTGEVIEAEDLPPVEQRERMFLVVRENFEEVAYAPWEAGERTTLPDHVDSPAALVSTLKPHQAEGLTWLARSVLAGRPGALLADDMGLGKTVQAIAFMAWLRAEAAAGRRPAAPVLIVAPTGLLGTWRDEIGRHLASPRLGPLTPAFGAALRSLREEDSFDERDIDSGRAALRSESWQDSGVVLTTYETLRDYHFSFAKTRFGLIVFDEVQKLKNPASQLSRAARTLNGAFTLAMTGTPVENRLQDLWSIMDVISPGLLGSSRDFERRFPADDAAALGELKVVLTDARDGAPPYMLRRLKSEALEGLPKKHIHRFEAEMPELQARAYRDLVMRAAAGAADGAMGQGGMLTILAGMRGVSLHPVDPRLATGDLDAYARDSARLSRTLSVLEDIAAKREKALVFVEDLAMQERLAGMIQTRFGLRQPPIRINGTVPGMRRQELVRRFQDGGVGFDVMILSPKAGGVGLTLTAANHVIHLSRWWNPAVEDQATDRVYRIGQTRDVHIHLPMAVHPDPLIRPTSFDLRLDALLERKRKLTQDLFLPPAGDDADLAELFKQVSEAGPAPIAMTGAPGNAATTGTRPGRAASSLNWRVGPGDVRPTDEVMRYFAGRRISHVRISDPYALCRRSNRLAQITFLRELRSSACAVEAVTVTYAPDVPGDLDDAAQRRDFGAAFAVQHPGGGTRLTMTRRPKRGGDGDFHDRFVDLELVGASGSPETHTLSFGRGVEAMFDDRKECTVTYVPPSA